MSGLDVSSNGVVVKLGDGEHRVRFPVRSMIEIERHFGGIEACMEAFRVNTTEANFVVLSHAYIDGAKWDDERVELAMEDAAQIDLAMSLGTILMDRMAYGHPMSTTIDANSVVASDPKVKAGNGSTGPA
jgi:hypothetical protein